MNNMMNALNKLFDIHMRQHMTTTAHFFQI